MHLRLGRTRAPRAVVAVAALAVTAGVAGLSTRAAAAPTAAASHYTVGLFGDMPYGDEGRAEYPNLLADINAHNVAFSIFDGDLKAGSDGPCDNALYTRSLDWFNSLQQPLVWLPGDNDWTDCWGRYGPGTGGFAPLERLRHEREVFAPGSQSLGQTTLTLTRESSEGGAYAPYRENVRWRRGPVVFLGLNVQGSNDNLPHAGVDGETRGPAAIAHQAAEHAARLAANVHWLQEGFAYARSVGAKGVLVAWQADPNFNNEQHLTDPLEYDGLVPYVDALREQVTGFPGQVVLVHGDSHYFKVDKPLADAAGHVLTNFTRVETFGSINTNWVRATIDASDPNVFEFEPMIVPSSVG